MWFILWDGEVSPFMFRVAMLMLALMFFCLLGLLGGGLVRFRVRVGGGWCLAAFPLRWGAGWRFSRHPVWGGVARTFGPRRGG